MSKQVISTKINCGRPWLLFLRVSHLTNNIFASATLKVEQLQNCFDRMHPELIIESCISLRLIS